MLIPDKIKAAVSALDVCEKFGMAVTSYIIFMINY